LGDFLGDPDDFCLQVLEEFACTFDFSDMQIDGALRTFLESFRLPGEAQKIHRVLEAFSDRFYQQSKGILANKDAAFVLSYSVIMLNTDQHNVQVSFLNEDLLFAGSFTWRCTLSVHKSLKTYTLVSGHSLAVTYIVAH
jgi:hypothetical protein